MNKFTCIMCPVGCELTITQSNGNYVVEGNGCVRGQRYAIAEVTNPTRTVTSLVKTKKGIVSVKTTNLVPKNKIQNVLDEIASLNPTSAKFGQILIKNVAGLENTHIIVTRGL